VNQFQNQKNCELVVFVAPKQTLTVIGLCNQLLGKLQSRNIDALVAIWKLSQELHILLRGQLIQLIIAGIGIQRVGQNVLTANLKVNND
jgi:hypothetical protein